MSAAPALFLPIHEASLQDMTEVARAMAAQGELRPVFALTNAKLMAALGPPDPDWDAVSLADEIKAAQPAGPGTWEKLLPSLYLAWRHDNAKVRGLERAAERVFARLGPAVLVVNNDRFFGSEAVFVGVARRLGIPSLVVQNAYLGQSWLDRKDHPEYIVEREPLAWLKRLAARRHPEQVHRLAPDKTLIFYTAFGTLALGRRGLLPPNPWVVGGGQSSRVAVWGEEDRDIFTRSGVPAAKVAVTGQPSMDVLHRHYTQREATRAALVEKYGLDPNLPFIVCAVPQSGSQVWYDWSRYWDDIRTMVKAQLARPANLLLSLHPRMSRDEYMFLEDESGAHVLEEPMRVALPASDIYVGSASSTLRWAVVLGLPAIEVDFYGFNLDIYQDYHGVVRLPDLTGLAEAVAGIVDDPARYQELRRLQLQTARRISPFDGRACARIVAEALALCGRGKE